MTLGLYVLDDNIHTTMKTTSVLLFAKKKALLDVNNNNNYYNYYYYYYYYYLCIDILTSTLDAGLLTRSHYPKGPATGHLNTGFS